MEVLSPENQGPVKGIDVVWNRQSTAVLNCIQEKSRQIMTKLVDRVITIRQQTGEGNSQL